MKRIAWHLLALAFALARPTPSNASSVSEDTPTSFEETQSKEFEKLKEQLLTPLGPQETNTVDSYNRKIGEQIRDAEFSRDANSLLKGIKSFSVYVYLPSGENIITKQELKTKIELNLRRNRIRVEEKFGEKQIWVSLVCAKGQITNAYSVTIEVIDTLYHFHQNQIVKLTAPIWREGTVGYSGNQLTKGAITEITVNLVEMLSNAYLSQNSDSNDSTFSEKKPASKKPAQKK